MSVRCWQLYSEDASDGENSSCDHQYAADGSETLSAIRTVALSTIPSTYQGLYLQSVRYNHKGAGFWEIPVRYGKKQRVTEPTTGGDPGSIGFSADGTGKTIHRETSYATRSYGTSPPDFDNLIDVDPTKGDVKGVDLPTPGLTFTITKKYLASSIPSNFIANLYANTGKVNEASFQVIWKGQVLYFDEWEVMYFGPTISDGGQNRNGEELIEIGHKFEYSPNDLNITVGSITGVEKYGWDALWVLKEAATSENRMVRSPVAVYVEEVVKGFNFSILGLDI